MRPMIMVLTGGEAADRPHATREVGQVALVGCVSITTNRQPVMEVRTLQERERRPIVHQSGARQSIGRDPWWASKRGGLDSDYQGEGRKTMSGLRPLPVVIPLVPAPQPEDVFVALSGRDRKSTRLNSSHTDISRMPSSA